MSAIPIERIENRILLIGGRKVLLDADLVCAPSNGAL
jgi:hypothetical protein